MVSPSIDLDVIQRFRVVNRLKSVYRLNSVGDRKESSAEHSWSALLLADLLLEHVHPPLDRLKVFELLLYHDVVEIEADDVPLAPGVDRSKKQELEFAAIKTLQSLLPDFTAKRLKSLFDEYELLSSAEARFAKAVDALDALIHEMDYKVDWKGWSREFLVEKKAVYFKEFPKIESLFFALLDYLQQEGYFDG